MKKMRRVVLMVVVAVLMMAIISVSQVMAAENATANTILIDETSVSKGFTPALTYVILAQQERTTTAEFPTLPTLPPRT